jgi:hypothetical protein
MIGKGKRPRDPNQLAKWIVEQSTSEAPEPEPVTTPAAPVSVDAAGSAMGSLGLLVLRWFRYLSGKSANALELCEDM